MYSVIDDLKTFFYIQNKYFLHFIPVWLHLRSIYLFPDKKKENRVSDYSSKTFYYYYFRPRHHYHDSSLISINSSFIVCFYCNCNCN